MAVENPLGFMVHVVVKSFHHRSYSGNGESSSKHRIITHLNLVIRKFLDMKQYPDSEWSLLRSLIRLECHSPDQHVVIQQLQEWRSRRLPIHHSKKPSKGKSPRHHKTSSPWALTQWTHFFLFLCFPYIFIFWVGELRWKTKHVYPTTLWAKWDPWDSYEKTQPDHVATSSSIK